MNKARLLTLATFLDTVKPIKFNLFHWRDRFSSEPKPWATGSDGRVELTDEVLRTDCGTTACAIGWACSMIEFQAMGLGWLVGKGHPSYTDPVSEVRWTNWEAVHHFFGISNEVAQNLFNYSEYEQDDIEFVAKPSDVAQRIRETVLA
jgi:hypothetical protein